ncbi:hypothetical protein FGW37_25185 [Streptomyces rectiverticillatus]|uniref:hypothetical protein n=1 Tax=Streptomyces rectiverticillatus TaxID=173860 RepID=UPI0015C32FB4|nr:hypothetical protein [Streptomyces rectiverticillatus]QLE74451.1 hypothetical protein FGW37_25185 [Streptomyces rectiverticillatus]
MFTRVDEGPDTAGQLKLGVLDVLDVLGVLGTLVCWTYWVFWCSGVLDVCMRLRVGYVRRER